MAKSRKCIILCFIMAGLLMAKGDFSCTLPSANPNDDPPLPVFPGNSYQAHVEVNVLDKNYTMDIDEYLDYVGNRGLMKITQNGDTTSLIYSYDTDEVFYIKDNVCTVKNLTTDSWSFVYGNGDSGGDMRHIFGSAASLRWATNSRKVYQGLKQVRGISASKWSTCMDWPNVKGQVLVSYYFNTPEWYPSTIQIQLPLRIEVEGLSYPKGTQATTEQPSYHHFHHIYDFINFVPTIQADPTIFETPIDVICLGRQRTKAIPVLGRSFQYKTEMIEPASNLISHYSVWYNEDAGLVREDKIYTVPEAPVYTTHPVTEIHDFKTGVRYIKDKVLGNCSVWPISLGDDDSQVDKTLNQSIVIDMKDPRRFFQLDENYTYTGQRTVRGILCDVYSANIPNYQFGELDTDAFFHYFFMADEWIDVSNSGRNYAGKRYPVRLEIRSPELELIKVYNFYDFDDLHTTREAFDVSDCFDTKHKVGIKLTFPGTYFSSTEENWKDSVYFGLANVMGIPPIRISQLSIKHDANNIFVKATLLGTSKAAQFHLVSHTELEHADDKMYTGIDSSKACANLCINNPDFVCNSFDYCPDHNNACHLSRFHIQHNAASSSATICDHYSRTVSDSLVKEPTLSEAYTALRSAITNQSFFLTIQNPDGFIAVFTPIDVEITSGYLMATKTLPSLPSQFSHRLETVVPGVKRVADTYKAFIPHGPSMTKVWYDSVLKLVRMDTRNVEHYPYFEESTIHDFTSGLSYKINKVTEKCTISPIPNKNSFDVDSIASKATTDAGLIVKMKSPLQLLYLDDTYQYIGQDTVRGIMCDVFQSRRSDFHITVFNRTFENSVFTFYFQADDWSYYTADSLDTTVSQPLKLTIEDTMVEQTLIYNFFDFNDEHHSLDYYDASACFDADNTKTVVITFRNQPYHPTLDMASPSFINDALIKLADSANTSPVRFQKASLSYDDTNVYLMVTVLGSVPYGALFTPVQRVTMNNMALSLRVDNLDDCATACLQISRFRCQSFDFCADQRPVVCRPEHPRGLNRSLGHLNRTGECMHYSLTEEGFHLVLGANSVFRSLWRAVYRRHIQITISPPNAPAKVYTATDIRDGIYRPTGSVTDAGSLLKRFHEIKNAQFNKVAVIETHRWMNLGDCALKCLNEATFQCQAFQYNFSSSTCKLVNQHPDETIAALETAPDSNVYSLMYTSEYHQTANTVLSIRSDKTKTDTNSTEMCARACDEETDFRCESFNFCPGSKTCSLMKTNSLLPNKSTSALTYTASCSHYSRDYIFDFDQHPHKVIGGYEEVVVLVDNVTQCAVLCATGELKGCASFEICQEQRGEIQCKLSTVDPTVNKSLVITDSLQCSLYTVANPRSTVRSFRCPRAVSDGPQCPTKQKETSNGSSDIGAQVGIAFGGVFIGMLIALVATAIYLKAKSRKTMTSDAHPLNPMS